MFSGSFAALLVLAATAQVQDYRGVTTETLESPDPADWLSFSRTLDAQRYSPLDQIDRDNVGRLQVAWSRGAGSGTQESIPLVHDGVMYLIQPGSNILALDAANGDLIWEYEREYANPNMGNTRSKTIAIYEDVVITTTPDSFVVGLDAATGEIRWETRANDRGHSSGPIIADGRRPPRKLLHRRARRADGRGALEVLHRAGAGRSARRLRQLGRRPGRDPASFHLGNVRFL